MKLKRILIPLDESKLAERAPAQPLLTLSMDESLESHEIGLSEDVYSPHRCKFSQQR